MVAVKEYRYNTQMRKLELQAVGLANAMDTDFRDFRAHKTTMDAITDRLVGVKKKINTLRYSVDDLKGE